MKVTLIDRMGTDLTVVNAARVSFNKESDWICVCGESNAWVHDYDYKYFCGACGTGDQLVLSGRDKKLIKYLARHGHWTPFGHPQITLHIKVPIFVARQLHKHQVGFVVNEVSRRYVDEEPEFYYPEYWRSRPEDKKQGSGELKYTDEEIDFAFPPSEVEWVAKNCYRELLDHGIAPEQARIVLPLSTYTEFYMTGSLAAWARLFYLRSGADAQKEIQEVARQISEIICPLFPVSWEALTID